MPPTKSLQVGVGAFCSVLTKYPNPRKEITTFFKNYTSRCKVSDLIVIGREVKKVSKRKQICMLFRHTSFENMTIYWVKCWVRVISEGDQSHYFDIPRALPASDRGRRKAILTWHRNTVSRSIIECFPVVVLRRTSSSWEVSVWMLTMTMNRHQRMYLILSPSLSVIKHGDGMELITGHKVKVWICSQR